MPETPTTESVKRVARLIGDPAWEFAMGVAGRLDAETTAVLADRAIDRWGNSRDWRYYHRAGSWAARVAR